MDSKSLGLIFATIYLCLLLHFPTQAEANLRLINRYCKQTDNFRFCDRILGRSQGGAKAANMKRLTQIALDIARTESANTARFFNRLILSHPRYAKPLKACASYFSEASIFLNLKGLQGGTASLDVHNALDEAQRCETVLASAKARIPVVSIRIRTWKHFYSVAYTGVVAVESAYGF